MARYPTSQLQIHTHSFSLSLSFKQNHVCLVCSLFLSVVTRLARSSLPPDISAATQSCRRPDQPTSTQRFRSTDCHCWARQEAIGSTAAPSARHTELSIFPSKCQGKYFHAHPRLDGSTASQTSRWAPSKGSYSGM